jgi:Rod binding domain-containing protein
MIISNNVQLTKEQQINKLKKACEDFESFFYKMIFKSSNSEGKDTLIKMSNADKIFRDMYQDEISSIAAKKSSGGIKEMLFEYLKGSLDFINKKEIGDLNKEINFFKNDNFENVETKLDLKI